MEKCIDLSHWQGDVDFSQVKSAVDCVILREGYGTTIDKKFLDYVKGASDANLKIHGVYHFIYSLSSAEAREEAETAITNVVKAGLPKTTRIWCDLEYDTVTKAKAEGVTLGKNEINLFTVTFCQTIEEAGYPTGIYTNLDYYKNCYTSDTLSKYPIWLADYSGGADYECLVHQYSSSGKVAGISTKVDMNYCYIVDGSEAEISKVESAIEWMEEVANDDTHGYDQTYRWGEKGDYDCSSAVITAWEQAGVPVKTAGATYTGNMLAAFKKCGFEDVTSKITLSDGTGLLRGDVLLNTSKHTAMYCGNSKEVEASINEKGTATGGTPGDQTGKEFLIRSYRNYPWNYVLRYADGSTATPATASAKSYLSRGDYGDAVKTMQAMLIACGFSCGTYGADGQFGASTYEALVAFQMFCNITQDGKYGPQSKAKLESLYASVKANVTTPTYTVGKTYALQAEMRVRFGAGVTYVTKTHSQLTSDGQKHDVDKDGALDKGTTITCQEVKAVGGDTWIRCPSGWIAAVYGGKVYVK